MFLEKYVKHKIYFFVCFVLGVYRPTREFFTHMETSRYSWPLSSEGSLTCHTYCDRGLPPYNGDIRGPVTLTPVAEHLAVELSLAVITTLVCHDFGLNPDLPHAIRTLYLYTTPRLTQYINKLIDKVNFSSNIFFTRAYK